jgi:hypothetical protein
MVSGHCHRVLPGSTMAMSISSRQRARPREANCSRPALESGFTSVETRQVFVLSGCAVRGTEVRRKRRWTSIVIVAKPEIFRRAPIWILGMLLLVDAASVKDVKTSARTGTIKGTVADSSGGTVSGTRIDARNEGTGVTFYLPGTGSPRSFREKEMQAMKNSQGWDTSYEWKAVSLLGLGFGLVGLDRWIIAPLFPFMMRDLHLGYEDLGNLVGILGICWGAFAAVMGGISDKIGRRRVLIPAIFLFSILSGLSGIATGLTSLIIIRAIMGVTEGSFCLTSFAATNEASEPQAARI